MKNKFTKYFTGFLAGCVAWVFFAGVAVAANLDVVFEQAPLFNEANIAPGNSVTRFIQVTNNTTQTQPIAIEAINKTDPDGLSEQLDLLIEEGGNTRFAGTLKQFFDAGEYYLSDLDGSTSARFDATISFKDSTDNNFQGKTLGFDLIIGFQHTEGGGGGDSGPNSPVPPGGGGGGGGGGLPPGLSIFEDQIFVTDITQTSAVVNWTTSYAATSQVVYAAVGESFSFVVDPAVNYGYHHATVEDPVKVTNHSVQLTGLAPETQYNFRVISHASPATVSYEHKFTTLSSGRVAGEQIFGELPSFEYAAQDGKAASGVAVANSIGSASAGQELGGDSQVLGIISEARAAESEPVLCAVKSWWYFGYIIYLLLLALFVWLSPLLGQIWKTIIPSVLAVAALSWWWFEPCVAKMWYWPVIILALVGLSLWLSSRPQKPMESNTAA